LAGPYIGLNQQRPYGDGQKERGGGNKPKEKYVRVKMGYG